MNLKNTMRSERNQSQKATYLAGMSEIGEGDKERERRPHVVRFQWYKMSAIVKSIEMKGLVVARGWLRAWGMTANGYGASFLSDENVLKLNNGGRNKTVNREWYVNYISRKLSYKVEAKLLRLVPENTWLHVQNMVPHPQCYPLATKCIIGTTCLTIEVTLCLFISSHSLEHSEL